MEVYQLLFAAAQPVNDGTTSLHVFEVAFEAGVDALAGSEEEATDFVDQVIGASLEAKGVGYLIPFVIDDSVHVCVGKAPCTTYQILLAELKGTMPSGWVQANQRNEA